MAACHRRCPQSDPTLSTRPSTPRQRPYPQEEALPFHRPSRRGLRDHGSGTRRLATPAPHGTHRGQRWPGRADPAPQSRGRGVGPRGHAAVPGRHRLGHGDLQAGGLLQVVPRPHLLGHHLAVQPGGAGRLGDGHRGAPPAGPARDHRRPVGVRLAAGQHAVDRQRRVLRQDHRGARPAAAAGVGGRRDHRARLQPSRGRLRGARPGREPGLRRRPAPGGRLDDAAAGPARARASTTSSSSSPGASRSPAWPPATPTSTSSWPGCSRPT